MKIINYRLSNLLLIVAICSLFSGCEIMPIGSPMPLSVELSGRWQWVKTVTPTKTLTPETEGYNQDLSFGSNSNFDYTVIYRDDTLYEGYIRNRSKGMGVNNKESFIIINYRNPGVIKYYLKFNEENDVNDIKVTPFMKEYSSAADTVRHFYKRVHLGSRSYE